MSDLPSFPLIRRSIYRINIKVKMTKLVNGSISLPAKDPHSIL